MSATIDVYPTLPSLPLIEQTCRRAEELFQQLLLRNEIETHITIEAFLLTGDTSKPTEPIPPSMRWAPSTQTTFVYSLDGRPIAASWPSCVARTSEDIVQNDDYGGSFQGRWYVSGELVGIVPDLRLQAAEAVDWYWYEYRNAGGHPVASTGYGLVAAALAEQCDGIIASFDSAFEWEHCGESAAQFLSWWGDAQLAFYGPAHFLHQK